MLQLRSTYFSSLQKVWMDSDGCYKLEKQFKGHFRKKPTDSSKL